MSRPDKHTRVSVVQIGARNHYITASVLDSLGQLNALYTDVYLTKKVRESLLFRLVSTCSPVMAKIIENRTGAVDDARVRSYWRFAGYGLARRYLGPSIRSASRIDEALAKGLAEKAADDSFGGADAVYGYSAGSKELFRAAKKMGLATLLDQASASVETAAAILKDEADKWKGWEEYPDLDALQIYTERQQVETELADVVLAPSDFVRRTLEDVGVRPEKIQVVPYGLEMGRAGNRQVRRMSGRPLNILFVGNVSVQKGVPYLLESARKMSRLGVRFRVVGPLLINEEKLKPYSSQVEFTGRVPRDAVSEHYRWADILCLPSLCEGFGLVQVEALAHGVPVITTTNAGEVVRHEVEGLIVPPADAGALCLAIEKLLDERDLLEKLSARTGERLRFFSYESYRERLHSVVN